MDRIKNSLRKASFGLKRDFLTVENVVLLLAIVLCLVWAYQSVAAMSRNWELSERLTAERKTLELLNIEVEMAGLENEYYQTNEYQELMARRNMDKKASGENMVVMPENSDIAKNKHNESTETVTNEEQYSNFQKWMMYLFPKY